MKRLQHVGVACLVIGVGGSSLWAQVPTVTTDGSLSNPAAPPPSSSPPPPITVNVPGGSGASLGGGAGAAGATGEAKGPQGFYYQDGGGEGDGSVELGDGPVPASHTIVKGDTLWDISTTYFNNPWEWPRVWSYNPEITNPHWIYPGGNVRLYAAGQEPIGTVTGIPKENQLGTQEGSSPPAERTASTSSWFSLRQLAFVDRDKLAFAGTVVGSVDEKRMLSDGDSIYIDYPKGKPPTVGKKYAVYAETKQVKHPRSGEVVGAYVRVIGEIEVRSVKQGKRARAIVVDAIEPIERGKRVGPLERTFKNIEPKPNQKDVQGTVVAQLTQDELIGALQVVFIDKGKRDGLATGNTMFVIRRGDALMELGGRKTNGGQNDEDYPARAVGEIMIAQAGERTSVGLVTNSVKEIEIGDMLLARKGGVE